MTKIEKKLQKNQNRLKTLNNRYEKLIELNLAKRYLSMILTESGLEPNPKSDKYLKTILEIKQQKTAIWTENRQLNEVYRNNIVNGMASLTTLTRAHLFTLTSPMV